MERHKKRDREKADLIKRLSRATAIMAASTELRVGEERETEM